MRRAAAAAAGLIAAVGAGPVLAQDGERPRIRIDPRVVTYGDVATVDAKLVGGAGDADTPVALLERRLPGDGKYREIARLRAAANGSVRFTVEPEANAYYAVRTRQDPVQTSLGLLVRVRPLVHTTLSDAEPARGATVTLAGTIRPAVDGAEVTAERRAGETWRVVGTATAQAAAGTGGDAAESTYEVAFEARRSGRYRVVVAATDALSRGFGEVQRLRVGRRAAG